MAKQIQSYTVSSQEISGSDYIFTVDYRINDSVHTDLKKIGRVTLSIPDSTTLASSKALIEAAIKDEEGIA